MFSQRGSQLTQLLQSQSGDTPQAGGSVDFGLMIPTDPTEIARKLIELKVEHRDLDQVIARVAADKASDELQLTRLKKRKLRIKDMIAYLESKLIPDLDA